jgi:DNA-binding transcriptional ArsR family regulator
MARSEAARRQRQASVFAALGDDTRLWLVGRLADGGEHSIAELTEGSQRTRQAVTKHLHLLESAKVVRSTRTGREARYALDPARLQESRAYLDFVAGQWDDALARLQAFVDG